MKHKRSKNYSTGGRLKNGMKIETMQGFADTESKYLNANGRDLVPLTTLEANQVYTQAGYLGGVNQIVSNNTVVSALNDEPVIAIINNEEYTIAKLANFGAFMLVSIKGPNSSNVSASELSELISESGVGAPVYLQSDYTAENLPDAVALAKQYFDDELSQNCDTYNPSNVKAWVASLGYNEGIVSAVTQDVQLQIAVLCDQAAAGDPVVAQVLDQEGNVITIRDRVPLDQKLSEINQKLDRYDAVIKEADNKIRFATQEYNTALQACDDDTNQDDAPCNDAADLASYINDLRQAKKQLENDLELADAVQAGVQDALDGTLDTTVLDDFTEETQQLLTTIKDNALGATQGAVDAIAVSDAAEDISDIINQLNADLTQLDNVEALAADATSEQITSLIANLQAQLASQNLVNSQLEIFVEGQGSQIESLSGYLNAIQEFVNDIANSPEVPSDVSAQVTGILDTVSALQSAFDASQSELTQVYQAGAGGNLSALQEFVLNANQTSSDLSNLQGQLDSLASTYGNASDSELDSLSQLTNALANGVEDFDGVLQNAQNSLDEYTALGTVEAFEDALEDANEISEIVGLSDSFVNDGSLDQAINNLINQNQDNIDTIGTLAFALESYRPELTVNSENILDSVNDLIGELQQANQDLENAAGTAATDAETSAALTQLNTQLEQLVQDLDSDLDYYENIVTQIEDKVDSLGSSVDSLETYLIDEYGYSPVDEADIDADPTT